MNENQELGRVHPQGEEKVEEREYPGPHRVRTPGGSVEVRWEEESGMSLQGPLVYFLEFLVETKRWERFVERCPLIYTSPNAPSQQEILGTILFSVLNGHRRYAPITGMRGDGAMASLLGIERFRSEDSVRRAFEKQDEEALTLWMDRSLNETFEALLEQEWVMDVDATVKTLYGKQEEARVGYNPIKPGRPSHVYHAMLFTEAKLILNVDVQAGNQTASLYGPDSLWGWLEARERRHGPTLVRGDCGHGNEQMMAGCEERGRPYLFKLKQSKGVSTLGQRLSRAAGDRALWQTAGQGWEGCAQRRQLQGWSRVRRVLVLRRKLERRPVPEAAAEAQLSLPGMVVELQQGEWYEHAVLVTSWEEKDVLAIAQLYRDRGDAENQFDELKNQWGWRGYSTADLKRSQLMARLVALIFNWWSIYTRLATGGRHGEAITTRPLLQQGVARQTTHANQKRITISSMHAKAKQIANLLVGFSSWLRQLILEAEQFTAAARWALILRRIFQDFAGFPLTPPGSAALLAPSNCRI